MKAPLFFTTITVPNTGVDRYASMAGAGSNVSNLFTPSAGALTGATYFPIGGTFSNLRVRFPTALTQGTYVITLMTGSAPNSMTAQALSATVAVGTGSPVDLVNTVTVAAGSYACWKITPTGTPTTQTAPIHINCQFEATITGRTLIHTYVASSNTAGFVPVGVGASAPNTTGTAEAIQSVVMPMSGTIRSMHVHVSAGPGAGITRTVVLRKGTAAGALSDAITVTVADTNTLGSADLSGAPLAVAAGDYLVYSFSNSATPASAQVKIVLEFVPTTSGDAPRFWLAAGGLSATSTRYGNVAGTGPNAGDTTEAVANQPAPVALTVKSIRVDTSTAPGAGKSRTITLRNNGSPTTGVVTLSETEAFDTATVNVAVAAGDLINYEHVPASTPASSTWTAVSSVMSVDAGGVAVNFSPSDVSGQTFEGIRNTSKVIVGGAYSGTPTNVEVALYDAPTGGNIVSAWATATTQTGGAYSHTFTGVAVGGPYYQRVRDNGGTATNSSAELYVGAILILWGQSQCQKLHTTDLSALAPSSGMQVRVLTYSSQNNVNGASTSITRLTPATVGVTQVSGAGVVAIANQWHIDTAGAIPLMIVTNAYQGTSIEYWVNNRKGDYSPPGSVSPTEGADPTTLWGTSATTGFTWFMAAAAKYQATAVSMLQGTSDTNHYANVPVHGVPSGNNYAWFMDALKTKFETLYNGVTNPPLFLVNVHPRSNDGTSTFAMRQMQYEKATSGGNWRLNCFLLDWVMDFDASPHQAQGGSSISATLGNIRGGTRIGRGYAKNLHNNALDILGPQISSAQFTDTNRNVIEITFDRNIEQADGTAYSASPITLPNQWVVATNSNTTPTFSTIATPGLTAQITAANKVRLTKTGGGSWPSGTTRIDYLRGVPYTSTNSNTADYISSPSTAEASLEANYTSKVITDTTSFDSNRGMPMASVMGTGFAVADAAVTYTTITAPNSAGITLTLTKAQLATLRVKAGSLTPSTDLEAFSLRWNRVSGDTTGTPVDGINVDVDIV